MIVTVHYPHGDKNAFALSTGRLIVFGGPFPQCGNGVEIWEISGGGKPGDRTRGVLSPDEMVELGHAMVLYGQELKHGREAITSVRA